MKTFLDNTAQSLYDNYGDDIASLKIVLPNMRSRLFFQESLSGMIDKPVWQPQYLSIDDIMSPIAGLRQTDRVRAVVELYKVYSEYHQEPFDSFYFWGEMLLGDFDQIDKYMVNAKMLFANLRDLKNMGSDLSYLSPDQLKIISRFWDSFGDAEDYSRHQKRFLKIWDTLGDVYQTFRQRLFDSGIGYQGMIYRHAAESIKSSGTGLAEDGKYIIVGFNALSASEKILFDHLKAFYGAEFFWDADDYYLNDKNQEAGLFIRDNIRQYPGAPYFLNSTDNFRKSKKLAMVSTASDSLQCKYAGQFLEEVVREEGTVGKNTAIVLTDESLLVPLLYSLPEEICDINVTMGYPLRQTLAYGFVERLLKLQDHSRKKGDEYAFYHNDVTGLLKHPYILSRQREEADKLAEDIVRKSRIYVKQSFFTVGGTIESVFAKQETWQDVAEYIIATLSNIDVSKPVHDSTIDNGTANREFLLQREYFGTIAESVRKLTNSLEGCGVEITVSVFSSLLRRMMQSIRIPYSGEPLKGIQVMGILETRNLDFDNVLILSMNDDTFPGNLSSLSSFVPYNLRVAYGLPTPQHHEGVYAYYFYRLLQRAKRVDMVYCAKNDEKSSGEQSRYIYQLDYETEHPIRRVMANVDVNLAKPAGITVAKDQEILDRLESFVDNPDAATTKSTDNRNRKDRSLSPTAFYAFIECPLKFYFRSIAGLKAGDEITEEIDMPMFGTILHSAMERLYKPFIGIYEPSGLIEGLINSPKVTEAVNDAITKEYLKDGGESNEEDFEGEVLMIRDIVCRYINNNILPFDAGLKRYTILSLENPLHTSIKVNIGGRIKNIRFSGTADRVEMLDNGTIRIVDYKTGMPHSDFTGIEQLFSDDRKERNAAVFQTMLYSRMAKDMQVRAEIEGEDVCPVLYYVRNMNKPDYSPQLKIRNGDEIDSYSQFDDCFSELLGERLSYLYDSGTPFSQCEDIEVCKYCDYIRICNKM